MKDYKDDAFRMLAYFCADHSIVTDGNTITNPICLAAGKNLCCGLSLGIPPVDDCGITCDRPVYSQEQGLCEGKNKCLCCYTESQCPPGKDIGCAICGAVLVGQSNGREVEPGDTLYVPVQECM